MIISRINRGNKLAFPQPDLNPAGYLRESRTHHAGVRSSSRAPAGSQIRHSPIGGASEPFL